MRELFAALTVATIVVSGGVAAFVATETVTGKIVDHSCYMRDKVHNTGNDHKMPADVAACATACARKGRPLALLTADGKVYTIAGGLAAGNNAKLVPHITHTVSITGDVVAKDGASTITADALKMVSR